MNESTEPRNRLVDHLEELAREGDKDRATLALLRGSLQEGRALDGLRVVLPYIARDAKRQRQDEDDALLLAGLFATHPESGEDSLASALHEVATRDNTGRINESIELRFRALLGASRQDLPTHLRHAVGLVASHKLAIDWRDLHTKIRFWESTSDRARREWARDFWTSDEGGEAAEISA